MCIFNFRQAFSYSGIFAAVSNSLYFVKFKFNKLNFQKKKSLDNKAKYIFLLYEYWAWTFENFFIWRDL